MNEWINESIWINSTGMIVLVLLSSFFYCYTVYILDVLYERIPATQMQVAFDDSDKIIQRKKSTISSTVSSILLFATYIRVMTC